MPTTDIPQWAARQAPYLTCAQFSLAALEPVARLEVLYALQQRDNSSPTLEPTPVRQLVSKLSGVPSLALDVGALARTAAKAPNLSSLIRSVQRSIRLGLDEFRGIKPTDRTRWDLVAIGQPSSRIPGRRTNPGTADFEPIVQPWLRELVMTWARDTNPPTDRLSRTLRAAVAASVALCRRPGGAADPALLSSADMDEIMEEFRQMRREDGQLFSDNYRANLLSHFSDVIDYRRAADLMNEVPGSFARRPDHRITRREVDQDNIGKALPESVIRQLDDHLDLLGEGFPHGNLSPQDIKAMLRTAYVILRDTGRRPKEIATLYIDCLRVDGGEFEMLWDNHKGRRLRRRFPLTPSTAAVIREWQQLRSQLPGAPSISERYLFPAKTERSGLPHMLPATISGAMELWMKTIPVLHSEVPDLDGSPVPFDRELIFPYAFRHSFAQRHADAGTDVDVLRDLMDHRDISTTHRYYQVTTERKRAAVEALRHHVVDRSGRPTPMPSAAAYESRSVAVPYGNCIEPANVKAGGHGCAIRFQCAGCGYYRPDPSYLPAIEEHINTLRSNKETAYALEADEFVLRNLDDEIGAFKQVASQMRETLEGLPEDERAEIEEASTVMRKARASGGRALLPLTVIRRDRDGSVIE